MHGCMVVYQGAVVWPKLSMVTAFEGGGSSDELPVTAFRGACCTAAWPTAAIARCACCKAMAEPSVASCTDAS